MSLTNKCIFILGGARSGKSRFARSLAEKSGKKVLFVATAEPLDNEMRARIEEHKKNRPKDWRTLELTSGVGREVQWQIKDAEIVIIDCLTLLVSNLLIVETDYTKAEKVVMKEIDALTNCIDKVSADFIIVSNEVGMGLVAENKLARWYCDLLGKVNQLIAKKADEVFVLMAGIPIEIKKISTQDQITN